MFAQLLALTALVPNLLLLPARHINQAQGLGITANITVQIQRQFARIGLVGAHPFKSRIQFGGSDNVVGHAQFTELTVQHKPTGPGLVATEHSLGQNRLLLCPGQEVLWTEPLGRFGPSSVDHPHYSVVLCMPIDAQLDDLIFLGTDDLLPVRLGGIYCRGSFYSNWQVYSLHRLPANTHAVSLCEIL